MSLPSLPAQPLTPEARRTGRLVLLLTLAVYATTTGGSLATDAMSYEVTKSLVEDGSVAMSQQVLSLEAHRGIDGRYYSPYGLGHPLYSIPFYVAGRVVEVNLGVSVGRPDALRKAAFVAGSAVAAALVVWVAFLFCFRMSGDRRAAVAVAIGIAFGTLLWPYSKFGFNAPLATLAVTAGVYAAWVGARTDSIRHLALCGAAFGFALLVRAELALAAGIAALWVASEYAWQVRRVSRAWFAIGVPIAIAVAITLAYNATRFGSMADTGYLRDGTATFNDWTRLWEGFAGLLFSPGRSLFLYSPLVVGGVWALARQFRRDRSTAWLLTSTSAALFAFYASLAYWDADRSYGPRYLVPIVPLLCVPLVGAWADPARRRAMRWVLVVSILIQVPGIAIDFTKAMPALGVTEPLVERRWRWDLSGLVLNTRALIRYAPDNLAYLSGAATPPPPRAASGRDAGFSEQFSFSLDVWWLYLFYFQKVPAAGAVAIAAALLGLSAALALRLKRAVRTPA
jgi:hypothetical protein